MCNITCPDKCTCHGLAFTCMGEFLWDVHNHPDLRCLDLDGGVDGNGMVEGRLQKNILLIHLSVVGGRLTRFINVSLPNLNSLDIRDNHIECLCHISFLGLKSLRILVLHGNPLSSAVVHLNTSSSSSLPLSVLDLTSSRIPELKLHQFSVFSKLHTLNVSGCRTRYVTGEGVLSLGKLRVLDMQGCPITAVHPHAFRRLVKMEALYGSTYKLCCANLLPEGFNLHNCVVPPDSLSDCDRLLKDHVHVVFMATSAALATLGNVAGCVTRLVWRRSCGAVFRVLMLHLSVSDGMMGIYLAIVTVASWMFQGRYQWQDTTWRRSQACHLSAFLSVLSSQVSAGIVCLVTLDSVTIHCARLARIRFKSRSLQLSSAVTWAIGLIVAMVTTFHMTPRKAEGSDHALCTPMLVTHPSPVFTGYIILNCVLHMLSAAGDICITCHSWLRSDLPDTFLTTNTSAEESRRLTQTYIATLKVLCWFVVSLPVTVHMGNVTLPEEAAVNIAVFVLPLNATLNPLLSVLAEVDTRRRQAQKARLMKILAAKVTAKAS